MSPGTARSIDFEGARTVMRHSPVVELSVKFARLSGNTFRRG